MGLQDGQAGDDVIRRWFAAQAEAERLQMRAVILERLPRRGQTTGGYGSGYTLSEEEARLAWQFVGRGLAAMQMVSGAFETAFGFARRQPVLAVHGLDTLYAGARGAIEGQPYPTHTNQAVAGLGREAGLKPEHAQLLADSLEVVVPATPAVASKFRLYNDKAVARLQAVTPSKSLAPGVKVITSKTDLTEWVENLGSKGPSEWVWDPRSGRMAVGDPEILLKSVGESPHEIPASSIDADTGVVGGMIHRLQGNKLFLDRQTGHFYRNWKPHVLERFKQHAKERLGLDVQLVDDQIQWAILPKSSLPVPQRAGRRLYPQPIPLGRSVGFQSWKSCPMDGLGLVNLEPGLQRTPKIKCSLSELAFLNLSSRASNCRSLSSMSVFWTRLQSKESHPLSVRRFRIGWLHFQVCEREVATGMERHWTGLIRMTRIMRSQQHLSKSV
jgi:hypothetical protein